MHQIDFKDEAPTAWERKPVALWVGALPGSCSNTSCLTVHFQCTRSQWEVLGAWDMKYDQWGLQTHKGIIFAWKIAWKIMSICSGKPETHSAQLKYQNRANGHRVKLLVFWLHFKGRCRVLWSSVPEGIFLLDLGCRPAYVLRYDCCPLRC